MAPASEQHFVIEMTKAVIHFAVHLTLQATGESETGYVSAVKDLELSLQRETGGGLAW
jgi:hypothetical protein